MNKAIITRKGIMGIALVAMLVLGVLQVNSLMAAERIDLDHPITITAKVAEDDESVFAKEFKGKLEIRVYKIADMDETGKITADSDYSNIPFSILSEDTAVEDIKSQIVTPALAIAKDKQSYTKIELDRSTGQTEKQETLTDGAGIYLYVPQTVSDKRYTYSFTSYILMAPTSEYIMTGKGSDEWDYDVEFSIKAKEEQRLGDLAITKKLDTFNKSLGTASFVYKVTATLDDEVILDNVYSIDFTGPGSKTRTIEKIPATAKVTVEEVYTGASYEIVGNAQVTNLEIVADGTVTANFENDYDDKLIVGGISAENQFTVDEDGTISWINEEGQPEAQVEVEEAQVFR